MPIHLMPTMPKQSADKSCITLFEKGFFLYRTLPSLHAGRGITVAGLVTRLNDNGYQVSVRSVQRMLRDLQCAYMADYFEENRVRYWHRDCSES